MSDFRESLLTRIIRIYGFEDEVTIDFARLLENPSISDYSLETIVKAHEEHPYMGEGCWE